MCRSIKPLFNLEPPVTEEEIEAAALQYVRKISGQRTPSRRNQVAFEQAVSAIAAVSTTLLASLETHAPKRSRESNASRRRDQSLS